MSIIIRTAFNNQHWRGQCQNAAHDDRLFQCRKKVINVGFRVTETGQCAAPCWEQNLCTNYAWYTGKEEDNFGDRAVGRAYFIYRDTEGTLVLWGKSKILSREGNTLNFEDFEPLPENEQIRGLTYKYFIKLISSKRGSKWGSNTFRYLSRATADALDARILQHQRDNIYKKDGSDSPHRIGLSSEGESEQHKVLKEYVAENPSVVGLPMDNKKGETEYLFKSGDKIDVLFRTRGSLLGVEVKSILSKDNFEDLERGIYQVVKYRALLQAEQKVTSVVPNARAMLVTEHEIPTPLQDLAKLLGVEVRVVDKKSK